MCERPRVTARSLRMPGRFSSVLRLLWKLVHLGLMATGSIVLLTVLAVAGLLAWDYVDQAMSQGKDEHSLPSPSPVTT